MASIGAANVKNSRKKTVFAEDGFCYLLKVMLAPAIYLVDSKVVALGKTTPGLRSLLFLRPYDV